MIDPGWLFVIAGLGILTATLLIPAMDELSEVVCQRDRALALERHRLERLEIYRGYLESLDRREPSLVLALAASQLNQIPHDRTLILETPDAATGDASVFHNLEPGPVQLPTRSKVDSLLAAWATDDRYRTWLFAAGGLCLLLGLLPRIED